jgi:hypothetical protein
LHCSKSRHGRKIIPALKRHLQELPWLKDGLALSERISLQILEKRGSMEAASLFYRYASAYEPLSFFGDRSYWLLLEGLANALQPAIKMEKAVQKADDRQVSLTSFSQQLPSGKVRWTTENPYDRWFDGLHNRKQAFGIGIIRPGRWRICRGRYRKALLQPLIFIKTNG